MTHRFDPTSLREYDIRGIVGKTLGDRRRHARSAAASPRVRAPRRRHARRGRPRRADCRRPSWRRRWSKG